MRNSFQRNRSLARSRKALREAASGGGLAACGFARWVWRREAASGGGLAACGFAVGLAALLRHWDRSMPVVLQQFPRPARSASGFEKELPEL